MSMSRFVVKDLYSFARLVAILPLKSPTPRPATNCPDAKLLQLEPLTRLNLHLIRMEDDFIPSDSFTN